VGNSGVWAREKPSRAEVSSSTEAFARYRLGVVGEDGEEALN
jgi:hypothetical protein